MSTTISKQKAFFSIHRLVEMRDPAICDIDDQVIDMYVVLDGGVSLVNKQSRVTLQNNNLYWVRYDKYLSLSVQKGTEGYAIRFSKTLLHDREQGFFCSFLAAYSPPPQWGQIIEVGEDFFSKFAGLCELMRQEFETESNFKMEVIRSLLGIFLLNLIRRSDIVMYLS